MAKNLPANPGDVSLIPGSGRPPKKENGNPLEYSELGNPMNSETSGLQSMGLHQLYITQQQQQQIFQTKFNIVKQGAGRKSCGSD